MLNEMPRRSSPQASAHRVSENLVRSMASVVARWIEIHRQREQLAELEDHQLGDQRSAVYLAADTDPKYGHGFVFHEADEAGQPKQKTR